MTWHAEVITLTLRRFGPGKSFVDRDKFASVATAQILGGKRAYISGFLDDGSEGPIHRLDWLDLAKLMREKFGVLKIESERHASDKSFDTGPAPLT